MADTKIDVDGTEKEVDTKPVDTIESKRGCLKGPKKAQEAKPVEAAVAFSALYRDAEPYEVFILALSLACAAGVGVATPLRYAPVFQLCGRLPPHHQEF